MKQMAATHYKRTQYRFTALFLVAGLLVQSVTARYFWQDLFNDVRGGASAAQDLIGGVSLSVRRRTTPARPLIAKTVAVRRIVKPAIIQPVLVAKRIPRIPPPTPQIDESTTLSRKADALYDKGQFSEAVESYRKELNITRQGNTKNRWRPIARPCCVSRMTKI
jgi:hypothetical protein